MRYQQLQERRSGYWQLAPRQQNFVFHPGPVFTQVLLADEINRASPKTQSALLEAMEEKQVTVEGATRPLPQPFFVIATQNPLEQLGTYALPESQLDRFLMRISLGYPDQAAEFQLLAGQGHRDIANQLPALTSAVELKFLQQEVSSYSVGAGGASANLGRAGRKRHRHHAPATAQSASGPASRHCR